MKPSQYLRKGWVRNNLAVNRIGDAVEPYDKKACRWCILGSLDASYHNGGIASDTRNEIEEELLCELKPMGYEYIEDYNDDENRKQYEVIELMSKIENKILNKYKANLYYNRFY